MPSLQNDAYLERLVKIYFVKLKKFNFFKRNNNTDLGESLWFNSNIPTDYNLLFNQVYNKMFIFLWWLYLNN